MVRGPNQRPGLNVGEAHLPATSRVLGEFIRRYPPVYWEVELRRLEVLAHGDDVAPGVGEVRKRFRNLLGSLAHPQDQVRLRDLTGPVPLREAKDLERTLVPERRAYPVVEPLDGLEVVGEDVGLRVEDRRDVALSTLEVGR